ncbi:MAG: hypothetical protein ACW97X_14550 [Candidatus Hodarchaeales archaeon]|jgi:hypothetical protein
MEKNKNEGLKLRLYTGIYGGNEKSLAGPVFFLIIGICCSLLFVIISILSGTVDLQLFSFQEIESLRPLLSFPFIGFIQMLLFASTIVGLVLGPIGIVWYKIFG